MNTQNVSPPAVRRARVRGNRAGGSRLRRNSRTRGTHVHAREHARGTRIYAAPATTASARCRRRPGSAGSMPDGSSSTISERRRKATQRSLSVVKFVVKSHLSLPCPPKATQTCRTQRYGCARTRCWGMVVRSRGRCTQGAACGSVAHCPRGWPVRRGEAAGGKPRARHNCL